MNELIDYKKYQKYSKGLIVCLAILFILPKTPISGWMGFNVFKYWVMPLLWGLVTGVILFVIPKVHPVGRVKYRDNIYLWAMIGGGVFVGIRMLAGGFIDGFGQSPYDLSPVGIWSNVVYLLPPLVGKELIRAYVLGTYCKEPNRKAFILITLFMTLMNLNTASLITVTSLEGLVTYIAQYLGPELCQNILVSYLVLYGGAAAGVIYLVIVVGFEWFCPILPNLNWLTEGVIGMVIPVFAVLFITEKYEALARLTKREEESKENIVSWIITFVVSISLIWFVVGVFPIYPSVIATGSMEPMISPGDIILVKKIKEETEIYALQAEDVIQFSRDGILITHRILEVIEDEAGNRSFKTKGDNNSAEDGRLVLPQEVKGTLSYVIPKLGLPTLWLKSSNEAVKEEVEF